MNKLFTCCGLIALGFTSSPVFAVDGEEKYIRLQIADAYSRCSAYYEITASVMVAEGEEKAVEKARHNKKSSAAMALSVAEKLVALDVNDRKQVKQLAANITTANYQTALDEINTLSENQSEALLPALDRYKSYCAIALNDPEVFTRRFLSTQTSLNKEEPALSHGTAVVAH